MERYRMTASKARGESIERTGMTEMIYFYFLSAAVMN